MQETSQKFKYLTSNERYAIDLLAKRLKMSLQHDLLRLQFFGSKSRGDHSTGSDIDILVVVKKRLSSIMDKIADAHLQVDLQYDPHISLFILSKTEFEKNRLFQTPCFRNIERDGIFL